MNNLGLTVALATTPSAAFAELRERPRFWFPLLLIVLTSAGLVYWYFSAVDIDWYKEVVFGSQPKFQEMTDEQRATALSIMTPKTLLWGSLISALVVFPVVFLLEALYLLVAAKVTKLPQGFKHWFSLVCWASMPVLITTVVAAILMFLSDTPQLAPSIMQPLSLNELVLHRPVNSPGYALFEGLGIPAFLSWALMIIGIRTWSQRSWLFSATVTLLPWICIYGIWTFLAFR